MESSYLPEIDAAGPLFLDFVAPFRVWNHAGMCKYPTRAFAVGVLLLGLYRPLVLSKHVQKNLLDL